ncbi:bifunctional nicotinamidase/pyrazinamidase [Novispirillum sp. DQ9]|uniref:bifunctional nicotinamidase/pyrazinamidase n=1 Tax=Novispirillum sp. DQ9 TaxID=3398612 RepID=UPI003C7B7C3F
MSDSLVPGPSDALLVIDVQTDFCPGGALAVKDGDAVVPVINWLMPLFDTVVLTQDWHPADHASFASAHAGAAPFSTTAMPYGTQVLWPDHCVQGTAGAAFHPRLDTARAAVVVRKGMNRGIDSYSAFFENDRSTPTGLAGWLRDKGIGRVFCTGLATDFCVAYSALDARALGLEVVLVEDACRGIDLDNSLAVALSDMAAAGVTAVKAATLHREGRP